MNRAMFSGVAGLKAHQTKMDVIGNNIANVNTYGYKSQRAVFSDIYYQNLRSASAGSASRGGTNPSSIGYGSGLAAVQAQMTQSSMQNTGFGLDVAIAGEGFLQVMDPDGNIFYTKAGMLDYDANGYLTDINGNFVLGSTSTDGTPGNQKIKLDNVGSVDAKQPTKTTTINGITYTVTAANATAAGNLNLAIAAGEDLPAGLKAKAVISSTGSISVTLNAKEKFANLAELNNAINSAITEANNGVPIAAGTITLTADKNLFGTDAAPGTWTGSSLAQGSELTVPNDFFDGSLVMDPTKLNLNPPLGVGVNTNNAYSLTYNTTTSDYTLSTTVGGVAYTCTFANPAGGLPRGTELKLETTPNTGSISLLVEDTTKFQQQLVAAAGTTGGLTDDGTATGPQYWLGGASITGVSTPDFAGQGAIQNTTLTYDAANDIMTLTVKTANGKTYEGKYSPNTGGTVELKSTDPNAVQNALDGSITVTMPSKQQICDNLGIAVPANNADLVTTLQPTSGMHNYSMVASVASTDSPLTGAQIVGDNFGVENGTITGMEKGAFGGLMKIKGTSSGFTGNGTVDAAGGDFYASLLKDANGEEYWKITMNIAGKSYTTTVGKDTEASSLLLQAGDGDYIQVDNPKFDGLTDYYKSLNNGQPPVAVSDTNPNPDTVANSMAAMTGNAVLTATPSEPSRDLGLGAGFVLEGGTEGGTVTLDQLTNITIGVDGTVSVTHAEKGTVNVGKISLATFANDSGLQLEGNNYYSATANSGDPVLCDPGTKGSGGLKNSSLEMSNVDLSSEFADMITTQRGFQANSRIITVSDTMLEELINLKR